MARKIYKSRRDVKIDGVCAGIGDYFGLDSTMVRLAFVVFTLFGGSGILLYLICACIMPREQRYDAPRPEASGSGQTEEFVDYRDDRSN